MMKRNVLRGVLAVSVALGLIGMGTAVHAVPVPASFVLTPASGPVAGGTEVVVDALPEMTFTQVSAGNSHSLALAADGTAYAWGNNGSGQLGNDTTAPSNVPVRVKMPSEVTFTQVSAGNSHSVALATDGTAYAWGSNFYGQLGHNTTAPSNVPVRVKMPAGVAVTEVNAGESHSVALAADGTAYAWGFNGNGQLGDDTTAPSNVPVRVKMPVGVTFTQVSVGNAHSVALATDGNAYAWGSNFSGLLGNGTTAPSNVPVRVKMPAEVTFTQVSASGVHSVALAADGTAYAWGFNGSGQLGEGSNTARTVPIPVPIPMTVTGVSFGGTSGTDLVDNGDGSWTVTTPPHAAGPVDVVVSWAMNGVLQPDITHAGTFTYVVLDVSPTVTGPEDQAVIAGDAAVFTVETTGTPEPTLTWEISTDDGATWTAVTQADGTVSGDGKTLTVAATEALSGVQYRATATNSVGTATSAAATLAVTAAPVAPTVTDPTDQTVTAGDTATFTVEADGTPIPMVTWELSTDDGVTWASLVAGDGAVSADGKTLTVVSTEALSGVQYRAIATNSVGAATSAAATLTVSAVPVVPVAPTVTDPTDQAVTAGDTATFAVDATGTPAPTVTWEISADDGATWASLVAGDGAVSADGKTLTVVSTEALSGVQYRAIATNSVGAATSAAATLTVSAVPVVPVAPTITDPTDQAVTAGDTATFAVDATGTPAPTVTWEISADGGATWTAVTQADGTVSGDGKTLTVAATEALSGVQYRATATNSVGAATSAAATLTVVPVSGVVDGPGDSGGATEKDLARTGSYAGPSIAAAVLALFAGLVLATRRKHV